MSSSFLHVSKHFTTELDPQTPFPLLCSSGCPETHHVAQEEGKQPCLCEGKCFKKGMSLSGPWFFPGTKPIWSSESSRVGSQLCLGGASALRGCQGFPSSSGPSTRLKCTHCCMSKGQPLCHQESMWHDTQGQAGVITTLLAMPVCHYNPCQGLSSLWNARCRRFYSLFWESERQELEVLEKQRCNLEGHELI